MRVCSCTHDDNISGLLQGDGSGVFVGAIEDLAEQVAGCLYTGIGPGLFAGPQGVPVVRAEVRMSHCFPQVVVSPVSAYEYNNPPASVFATPPQGRNYSLSTLFTPNWFKDIVCNFWQIRSRRRYSHPE